MWWGIGVGVMAAMFHAFYLAIRTIPDMDQFLRTYPDAFRELFGFQDITSAAGYLNTYVMSLLAPLLLPQFAVSFGGGATSAEEEGRQSTC